MTGGAARPPSSSDGGAAHPTISFRGAARPAIGGAARPSISFHGAVQVLRPPEDGLPHLRRADDLALVPGSVATRDGAIAALDDDPAADIVVDASGCALVPGLVDCHTHLPFAGWRADEYEQKVAGVPYEEIARRGGGIAASARALAAAGDEAVLAQARALRAEMLAHGTTAFEAKTGYGLSFDGEARLVRLARALGADAVTGLFAHAVPGDAVGGADAWMEVVDRLAGDCDVDALDIYVESVAFANRHLERLGEIARREGVPLRAHVEQFGANRSVPVALAAGARSVDHLACLHPDDLAPLAAAECAAVLLPGAELLAAERTAPGRALADAGAICALATDCNPGTSPVVSLPLVIGLAVRRYGWSAREALAAATLNAAWVLGRSDRIGSIEPGKRADLVLLDGPVEHVPYRFGHNPVALVVRDGDIVHVRPDQARRIRE